MLAFHEIPFESLQKLLLATNFHLYSVYIPEKNITTPLIFTEAIQENAEIWPSFFLYLLDRKSEQEAGKKRCVSDWAVVTGRECVIVIQKKVDMCSYSVHRNQTKSIACILYA